LRGVVHRRVERARFQPRSPQPVDRRRENDPARWGGVVASTRYAEDYPDVQPNAARSPPMTGPMNAPNGPEARPLKIRHTIDRTRQERVVDRTLTAPASRTRSSTIGLQSPAASYGLYRLSPRESRLPAGERTARHTLPLGWRAVNIRRNVTDRHG